MQEKRVTFVLDGIKGYAFIYADKSIFVKWATVSCDINSFIPESKAIILAAVEKAK